MPDGAEPLDVAPECGGVREPHMCDQHRLGPTQVRVRGHDGLARRLRLVRECLDEPSQRQPNRGNASHQVQPDIDRHLFVSRTAGVQTAPAADALDIALDEAVDVPVGGRGQRWIGATACRIAARLSTIDRLGGGEHARAPAPGTRCCR